MTIPTSRLRQPRPTSSRRSVLPQAPENGGQDPRPALLALGHGLAHQIRTEAPHARLARLLRFRRTDGHGLTPHDHRLLDAEIDRLAHRAAAALERRATPESGPTPIPSGNAPEDAA